MEVATKSDSEQVEAAAGSISILYKDGHTQEIRFAPSDFGLESSGGEPMTLQVREAVVTDVSVHDSRFHVKQRLKKTIQSGVVFALAAVGAAALLRFLFNALAG